jgi:hypothetical protein
MKAVPSVWMVPVVAVAALALVSCSSDSDRRGGETARVKIVNERDDDVRLFAVDRDGEWDHRETIGDDSSETVPSRVGQWWVVTDEDRNVLRRFDAAPGMTLIRLRGGARQVEVKFENDTHRAIQIYRLGGDDRWQWITDVDEGDDHKVRTYAGTAWKVTTMGGRDLRRVRVPNDDIKVEVED